MLQHSHGSPDGGGSQLDIRQLKTFVAAAEEQSFSAAARRLSLSQSAVSRQIEALEDSCGLRLFARGSRSAELTEAGERLLAYAQTILQQADEAREALRELRELEAGELRVGATSVPARHLAAPALVAFASAHPRISLRLVVGAVQEIAAGLAAGSLHLGLISGPADPPGLFLEPCAGDRLVLVARAGHPLARRDGIAPSDLLGERLIVPAAGVCERSAIDSYLEAHGLRDKLGRWELGDAETVKQAVLAGGGIAFASDLSVALEERLGLIARIRGEDVEIPRQFFLAYSKTHRQLPAALTFAALVRRVKGAGDALPEPLRAEVH